MIMKINIPTEYQEYFHNMKHFTDYFTSTYLLLQLYYIIGYFYMKLGIYKIHHTITHYC